MAIRMVGDISKGLADGSTYAISWKSRVRWWLPHPAMLKTLSERLAPTSARRWHLFPTAGGKAMADETTEKRDRHTAVFGLFRDEDTLSRTIDALRGAGFRADDVAALLPDAKATRELAHEKHTKAPEGATAGATAGLILGLALGWFAGMGALSAPALAALREAGPLIAALAGAGAGAIIGTLLGALIGRGIPEYEAKRYESFVNDGGMLVSVHCADRDAERRARSILDGYGGHDIAGRREAHGSKDREVRA
jgi:hypothetical protein